MAKEQATAGLGKQHTSVPMLATRMEPRGFQPLLEGAASTATTVALCGSTNAALPQSFLYWLSCTMCAADATVAEMDSQSRGCRFTAMTKALTALRSSRQPDAVAQESRLVYPVYKPAVVQPVATVGLVKLQLWYAARSQLAVSAICTPLMIASSTSILSRGRFHPCGARERELNEPSLH